MATIKGLVAAIAILTLPCGSWAWAGPPNPDSLPPGLSAGAAARGALPFPGLHPELARPTKTLVKIFLWIVDGILAYPHIPDAQSRSVQGVSVLLGLMVSPSARLESWET